MGIKNRHTMFVYEISKYFIIIKLSLVCLEKQNAVESIIVEV